MKKIILSAQQQVCVFVKKDMKWSEYFMKFIKEAGEMSQKAFRNKGNEFFESYVTPALEVIELEIKNSVKFKVSEDGNEIVFT